MLLDICLGNRTAWKILFVLSEAPGKAITRKQIRDFTRMGNKVTMQFLEVLEKCGIVTVKKIGRQYTYRMNMANPYSMEIVGLIRKEKEELNNIDLPILSQIREFVHLVLSAEEERENIDSIRLFGSHAKKTYSQHSDIDLAIVTRRQDAKNELIITDIADKLGKRFGRQIQCHYFTEEEFQKKDQTIVLEIIKDGIKLI